MSVYLRAAKMLELGPRFQMRGIWCCCDVIRKAEGQDLYNGPANLAFAEIFKPDDAIFMWWPHPCDGNTEQTQQQRLLALLFMHWISK